MDLRSSKSEEQKRLQRKKNAEKVRKWREKQKMDIERHEDLKKRDRERKSLARIKQREAANRNSQTLQKIRKEKREEMKRYRQRKKQKNTKEMKDDKNVMKSSNLKVKKQVAVKRTQAWRLRVKLGESSSSSTATVAQETNDELPSTSFSSKYSKCRHLKKAKSALPKTPRKRAEVVEQLLHSPSTSKILGKKSVIVTRDCKRKLAIAEDIISALQENIAEVKQPNSTKSNKKHAYNILKATILKKRTKTSQKYVRKLFSFRRMSKEASKRKWWERQQRKRRMDALKENVKAKVKEYFLSAEISREVPNKKEVIKVKTVGGKKEVLQKHVMAMTLEDAFKNFKSVHPEMKIGFTMFKKLKPENVRKISETNRRTCLCQVAATLP